MKMCLVMILVMKVFIFSKTMIICLLCPLLCGLFFFWKGAKGELSYKEIRNVTINKSFFNKHGQAAQEAWFYIKDQVAFDAYMETLQELCRKDGISTKLTVCYNSLQGEKTYDIDEKIIDYVLVSYTLKVYIICTVEY